ncbi:MAG: hypothetical protein QM499_05600 [Flavobacteriaceae bacterium]
MNKIKSKIIGTGILFLILSCKTYTITTDSFREQMIKAKSEYMTEVEINNPLNWKNIKYTSNNIDRLIVLDKNGNSIYLNNSPSIEMRVTHRNGKKTIFYFDTVIIENDTLKGGRSRFIQKITKQIPMDSIVRIELQDGGKKYNYQN